MGFFHSSRNSKIESDMNYKKKLYNIQKKEGVPHVNIKISW